MDFTKFMSMLINSGLYLSRADLLGDSFEGTITEQDVIGRRAFYESIWPPSEGPPKISWEKFEQQAVYGNKAIRETMYINCWHMNNVESAAMWSQYTKSGEAIAIQSTFDRLRSYVDEKCYLGIVKYVDYAKAAIPGGNTFWPFLHKRLSFSHETELRLIQWNSITRDKVWYPNPAHGYWQKISLGDLIETIFVSPNSPTWYFELVQSVVRKFDLSIPVQQSDLGKSPIF